MLDQLNYIRGRRATLKSEIDLKATFEQWEESCVPSYCHPNWLAAYVSWQRLFKAVELAKKNHPQPRRILDFGSSVGELGQLLRDENATYEFIEQDPQAASYLASQLPTATRQTLEQAPDDSYDWVFAIDSLEHNENYAELLEQIAHKLTPVGILILSGPTENQLYRLGRKVAGFTGDYHAANIYDIERAATQFLERRDGLTIFPALKLFSLSVWSARVPREALSAR